MNNLPESANISIFKEIIDNLNRLIATKGVDEFTTIKALNGLEARAIDLKSIDLGFGFSALGSVAAARGNADHMHKFHKLSLQYRSDYVVRLNYAISMKNVKESENAARELIDLHRSYPDFPEVLDCLIEIFHEVGDAKNFLHYAQAFQALTEKQHSLFTVYEAEVAEARNLTRLCTAISTPAFLHQ